MPNLKHLLDELHELDVEPAEIKLPALLYEDLVQQAEDTAQEDE